MKKLIAFTMALSILSCGGVYVRSVYAADTATSIQNTQIEEKNSDLTYIAEAITNLLEYRGQFLGWSVLQEEVDGAAKVVVEYYCVDTRVVDLVQECIADQNLDESLVVFRMMPGNAEDPANRITDIETIYELLSAYVQENGLTCKVEMINEKTQEKENPDSVLIYLNWRYMKEVQVLKQYMASVNIDDSQHVLWWCEAGSEDPDITTTTVTKAEQGETTTTITTTTLLEEKNSDLTYIAEAITNLLEYRGQFLGWSVLQEEVDGAAKVVVEYYCVDTRVVDLVQECIADQNLDESLVVFRMMPGNAEDPANRITDIETIYELLSAYVQENGLTCKVEMINEKTQEKENPDSVLIYLNWRYMKEVQVLKQYMASVNIDDSQHVLWWCETGSEDPDITTTTATKTEQGETTTTITTTTLGEAIIESTTTAENQGDLPQTGNNTMRNLLAALGACGLIGTGMATVHASGIIQRKKDDEL